ncbi:TIR domain-containing protein [Dyadobacter psychrotolerans]|uniref:CD-NTase-associated protein 12/Pycsar effector protein TIR domain-containing protein n=1 Tax=Dyadobacter psychrotolerans TaxID=2541721 RepID=A0A4R5DU56_9BACT|nr:nucleotide-binding protein [Dyadobacter psychrotolerans]TDE18066.1 hypothetical protein E0F88_00495 [Dyadobacter psychrotolerans]
MYLDKEKLKALLKKAEELRFDNQIVFNQKAKIKPEKAIEAIVSGLSGWLTKTTALNNGAGYVKKLTEIKATLPASKANQFASSYFSDKDAKSIQSQLITLIKKIDKENKSIFIVHGRDAVMKDSVQSALRGLGIPNVILSNEDDHGQTIIEKFIKEANRCEYAIVLCSADDEGKLRIKGKKGAETPLRPRARQNVILELGYFLAKYGRENLFVLHPEESIEQPSDFIGVVYQTFDKAGLWKQKLVRELKKAGFKINDKMSDRL